MGSGRRGRRESLTPQAEVLQAVACDFDVRLEIKLLVCSIPLADGLDPVSWWWPNLSDRIQAVELCNPGVVELPHERTIRRESTHVLILKLGDEPLDNDLYGSSSRFGCVLTALELAALLLSPLFRESEGPNRPYDRRGGWRKSSRKIVAFAIR